jgi:aryl-alcohol dehydrogenase-like predicted oxidoreductase
VLAYSPLLAGAYTRADRSFAGQYLGPDTDARVAALGTVAKEVGATLNQVVYAWMIESDPPVIPLVAASTTEQMQENMGALEIELSAEQMAQLNAAA